MRILKIAWVILLVTCAASISYGYGVDQGKSRALHIITEKTVEVAKVEYVEIEKPVEIIKEVEVPQVITVNYTTIKEVYTQELKYPETYGDLLKLFYSIQIAPDDCDDVAEYARREAEKQGYYLGEVVLSGAEYNKVFTEHPIPLADYHAINFTWVGNDGYYVDFMIRDIKKATEFVRD